MNEIHLVLGKRVQTGCLTLPPDRVRGGSNPQQQQQQNEEPGRPGKKPSFILSSAAKTTTPIERRIFFCL